MEKNKICPFCGALIADDSIFCDQCGEHLRVCPQCGEYGKGKFCKHCGVPMQEAEEPTAKPVSLEPAALDQKGLPEEEPAQHAEEQQPAETVTSANDTTQVPTEGQHPQPPKLPKLNFKL